MDQNLCALGPNALAPSPLDPPVEPAEIEPRPRSPADELIRLAVLNALHWNLAVPRNRVSVEVRDGWVTLTGRVEMPYSKSCAERDALSAPDVRGVTNSIAVGL